MTHCLVMSCQVLSEWEPVTRLTPARQAGAWGRGTARVSAKAASAMREEGSRGTLAGGDRSFSFLSLQEADQHVCEGHVASPFLGPLYKVLSRTVGLVPVTPRPELQTKTEATNKKQTQNKCVCGTGSLARNETGFPGCHL